VAKNSIEKQKYGMGTNCFELTQSKVGHTHILT
jgi:hypothetical protein